MAHDTLQGLSDAEAARRLARVGPNALQRAPTRGVLAIGAETLREPMFLLLLGAAGLYLTLGDLGEGLFLLGGASVAVGLVIAQQARTEHALAALRGLARPRVRVIRDGAARMIPSADLVPGDLMLVGEGERLAADGLLVAGDVLGVDESALTGESAPVTKRLADDDETFPDDRRPGPETGPWAFSGTMVVRGQGVLRVARTGAGTALGRIGASLAGIEHQQTPLQKASGRIVGLLSLLALAFCVLVAIAYGLLRGDWVEGALAGVTIAISLVPEEFPMVLAVFLALGAWRLARRRVLVRRSAVIEALGGATVLCVDKTGTLTRNRMQAVRVWTPRGEADLGRPADDDAAASGAVQAVLSQAALASALRPVDPMDDAIRRLAPAALPGLLDPEDGPARVWPLRAERMAVLQAWTTTDGGHLVAAKGAPEAIFTLCGLEGPQRTAPAAAVEAYAAEGLRVLGVALARVEGPVPDPPEAAAFRFGGLIGFQDPLRDDAEAALKEARAAGVEVVMITGDHPSTALAIARAAGIEVSAGVLTGAEVAALSPSELGERLRDVRVFARIAPEQKLAIVEALKANGEVVAMTGDGVNDAPALEAAHIGVAMGEKGSDVAREAADLVLLDDNFASIVGGVRLGRRIFANLRRALIYVTAIHVPIAGLALAPVLLGWPPLLLPMHVVLMELAIDPICALAFEGEPSHRDAMRRPPRPPGEPLFGPVQLGLALLQGLVVLIAVLGVYAWALAGHGEDQARGAAFLALVLGNLILALGAALSGAGRLFARHRLTYWAIAASVSATLAVIMAWPPLASVFKVAAPDPALLALSLAAALLSGGWLGLSQRLAAALEARSRPQAADRPDRVMSV